MKPRSKRMHWPNVTEIAAELRALHMDMRRYKLQETDIEVRLQVVGQGDWAVHSGDPGYDTDHRGYWGAGSIDVSGPVEGLNASLYRDLAETLIAEAKDHADQDD